MSHQLVGAWSIFPLKICGDEIPASMTLAACQSYVPGDVLVMQFRYFSLRPVVFWSIANALNVLY